MRTTTWWLTGAVVLGGMVASSLASRPGSDVRERLAAFAAAHVQSQGGPVERPPLLGDGHAADARVCYETAFALLGRGDAGRRLSWRSGADADAVASALEPVVTLVRIGASARHVSRAPVVHRALATVHGLRAVLQSVRRRAVERGEWHDAVELWAAEVTLQLDLAPEQRQQPDLEDAWTLEHLQHMPPAAAAALQGALVRLDERLPAACDAAAVVAAAAQRLLDGRHRPPATLRNRAAAWREGFDPQRRELDAAAALVDAIPRLAASDARWPERSRRWRQVFAAVPGCESTHTGFALQWHRDAELGWQIVRTELRLLRLALAFTFGEPLPELADPFGSGPFEARIDGDVARFRSAATPRVLQRDAVRRPVR